MADPGDEPEEILTEKSNSQRRARRSQRMAAPFGSTSLGGVLVVAAAATLSDRAGWIDVSWRLLGAGVLVVIGALIFGVSCVPVVGATDHMISSLCHQPSAIGRWGDVSEETGRFLSSRLCSCSQATSRRAITFKHKVSSAPSKIDSTRASTNSRLTVYSSANPKPP